MAGKLELEVEKILELEIEILKKGGGPSSTAFLHTPKGNFAIDQFDFRDKPEAMELLREIAEEHQATMVVVMSHALISQLEDLPSGKAFIRREAISVYGEDRNTNFCIAQQYKRDKNNQIVLGEKTVFPKGKAIGPMTGIIYKPNQP